MAAVAVPVVAQSSPSPAPSAGPPIELVIPPGAVPARPAPIDPFFKNERGKFSYCVGVNIGGSVTNQTVDVDRDLLLKGFQDALSGGKTRVTTDEIQATIQSYLKEFSRQLAEKARKEGDAFLEANKKKDGVKVTASGLQYKVVKASTGATPAATSTVLVNYRGSLLSGKEFDSSYRRGQPAELPLAGVIKGWGEALQLMSKGSKYEVWIPANLAYGERPKGPIPPNSTLHFEIELLDIK
ncbi:MAG: FKBP-type peptidyl-prolyl cis-trans isomerase [Candidatus Riflebacteria bacterium]|nr:FKBP-type peptidyl-prolyl cis-trans isomerase [Candidatus Riflebacteria bacterium]